MTVPADQQHLGSEVSALAGGGQYVAELKNLVAAKMAELAETVNLARAGDHAGALRVVDTSAPRSPPSTTSSAPVTPAARSG